LTAALERDQPRLLAVIERAAWALFLICLPVTSFPFFPPAIGGGALVRPLSLYPLLILLGISVLPRLLKGGLPRTALSLLPFLLVALASSLLSLLRGIDPALGISVEERTLRALITLGLGVGMYLVASVVPRTPADLRFSLRALYTGLVVALAWGTLQAVSVIHYMPRWFSLLSQAQRYISTRRLFAERVSGPTYEPNWFAEQITFLYMPWLLGAVLSGKSVFPWRWRWLSLELVLLAWSVGILAFTFSRAGLINLAVLVFACLVFFRGGREPKSGKTRPAWRTWSLRVAQALLVLAILAGGVLLAGRRNVFFSRVWSYWRDFDHPTLSGYFQHLGFGARFIYSTGAFNTYAADPLIGVGLGNYGFYFPERLPDQKLASIPEVLRIITPEAGRNRLVTAKVFYFRLLAETGLIGTAAFLVFPIAILGCALYLYLSPDPDQKAWGTSSLLALLAFFMSAFSFDSFAIPNMWVVFGLITAAAWVYIREPSSPHS
jgi:hypothetical protein